MTAFERKNKYHVVKISDAIEYLTNEEYSNLLELLEAVYDCRIADGKELLKTVVVESDWPEYEKVWKMIEERVTNDH